MAIAMARLLGNRQKMASFSGLMLQVHSRKSTAGVLNTKSSGDNSSPYDVKMLSKQNKLKEALYILRAMEKPVDYSTYAYLLQACTDNKSLANGKLVHAYMTEMGFMTDRFFLNTLLNMYAKCGSSMDARRVFDQIPERNVFSWTLMIAAYARHGFAEESLTLFHRMQRTGIQPDRFTFSRVLPACADLASLKDVHEEISRSGFQDDIFLGSVLIDMYAKRGDIENARHVFDKIPQRDVVLWNGMIAGYAQNGYVDEALKLFQKMPEPNVVSWTTTIAGCAQNGRGEEALKLFKEMLLTDAKPNLKTFASVILACANLAAVEQGMETHEELIRSGFQPDIVVESALVDMYAKCGSVKNARTMFDKMLQRDLVSWNAMIAGYIQNGCIEEARKLFRQIPERDVVSWTTMIAGYAQNGFVDEALKLFQKMPEKNVVSWTSMIAGYAQNGHGEEALKLFRQMQLAGVKPNMKTFTSVLPACANLAALEQGMEIHEEIIRSGFQSDVFVESALVDMYAKCGSIEKAHEVFDKIHQRNVVSWNAIIAGYAMHGYGKEAIKLFEQMQNLGTNPNDVTFVCVLSACCHAGLVDEGKNYFHCMSRYYQITPQMEHYGCMVHLLCHAGLLDEAWDFINKMTLKPDATVWGCLLGACKIHNNIDLGEHVAERLFELDPKNASPYVLLSNIYAAAGKWDDSEEVRKMMRGRKVKKKPGCSWIEVDKQVYAFLIGDRPHSQTQNICKVEESV
eukprot:Gb_06089 [translate_table: standard]